MVLRGWGPGMGHNFLASAGPGPPWAVRLKLATQSLGTQRESISGSELETCQAHPFLLSYCLWVHSWNLPQVAPDIAESSFQSSCPPFLTSAWLFTQPNFPGSLETIRVRVPQGLTPPFSRCCPAPEFLWCQCPQSQRICTASMCLPLHLYSLQQFPASSPSWCWAALLALVGEGIGDLTLLPIPYSRHWDRCCSSLGPRTDPRDFTIPAHSPYCLFFNLLCNFCLHTSYKLGFHWLFTLFLKRSTRCSNLAHRELGSIPTYLMAIFLKAFLVQHLLNIKVTYQINKTMNCIHMITKSCSESTWQHSMSIYYLKALKHEYTMKIPQLDKGCIG